MLPGCNGIVPTLAGAGVESVTPSAAHAAGAMNGTAEVTSIIRMPEKKLRVVMASISQEEG
jgi:hypothetical protein